MERKDTSIGSIVVTYNRPEYTKITLQSYFNTIATPHHVLIVVDNASDEDLTSYLEELYNIGKIDYLILNRYNYHASNARNQGCRFLLQQYPTIRYIHFSDNDIEYKRGWDKEAINILNKIPKIGQIDILNHISDPDCPKDIIETYKKQKKAKNRVEYYPSWGHCVSGNCIIRKEIYDKIHWISKDWEHDNIFSIQVRRLGYKLACLANHYCHHLSWGNWDKEEYKKYYEKTFEERGKIGVFNSLIKVGEKPQNEVLVHIGGGIGNVIMTTPLLQSIESLGYTVHVKTRYDYSDTVNLINYPLCSDKINYKYMIYTHWYDGRNVGKNSTDKAIYPKYPDWDKRSEVECNMDLTRRIGYKGKTPKTKCNYKEIVPWNTTGYIVISPGYQLNYIYKCWDKWQELIDVLSQKYIVMIAGAKTDNYVNFNPNQYKDDNISSIRNIIGKYKLDEVAFILKNAEFFVGTDSGLLHLSNAMGTKTYGIYGPSSVIKNCYPDIQPISLNLKCQKGYGRANSGCRFLGALSGCDGHCLRDLSVEAVLKSIGEKNIIKRIEKPYKMERIWDGGKWVVRREYVI